MTSVQLAISALRAPQILYSVREGHFHQSHSSQTKHYAIPAHQVRQLNQHSIFYDRLNSYSLIILNMKDTKSLKIANKLFIRKST